MADRLNLSRSQLAAFLKDHQAIRQFELLFTVVSELVPDTVDSLKIEAGSATAKAELALGLLKRMADSLEILASAPVDSGLPFPVDFQMPLALDSSSQDVTPPPQCCSADDWLQPPPIPVVIEHVPVGTITAFRFATIPANWLELNGQTVNTGDYPELAVLYGAGGATMVLDDYTDLPLWGDGVESQGSVVGFDDRSCTVDLSGDNTTWTGAGESVLTTGNAVASSTNLTVGAVPVLHTVAHDHSVIGGNHDHPIKTYEYQTVPSGGEPVTGNAFSVLPHRAIIKWIIKARS